MFWIQALNEIRGLQLFSPSLCFGLFIFFTSFKVQFINFFLSRIMLLLFYLRTLCLTHVNEAFTMFSSRSFIILALP